MADELFRSDAGFVRGVGVAAAAVGVVFVASRALFRIRGDGEEMPPVLLPELLLLPLLLFAVAADVAGAVNRAGSGNAAAASVHLHDKPNPPTAQHAAGAERVRPEVDSAERDIDVGVGAEIEVAVEIEVELVFAGAAGVGIDEGSSGRVKSKSGIKSWR